MPPSPSRPVTLYWPITCPFISFAFMSASSRQHAGHRDPGDVRADHRQPRGGGRGAFLAVTHPVQHGASDDEAAGEAERDVLVALRRLSRLHPVGLVRQPLVEAVQLFLLDG